MSILEAAASAVGEAVAYAVGLVAGRTLSLTPKKAQTVGEYVVIGVILGAGTLITIVYS